MEISGFTFIKNGIEQGYPFVESIKSIAPLCDEVIINVGFDDKDLQKDDGTYELLRTNFSDPKFVFLKSWWDPNITSGGEILAQQTNIALAKCRGKFCQYIQGDEAIHQDDIPVIKNAVSELKKNPQADGIVFKYLHFYSSPDVVKYTRNTYRREIRLIRNTGNIISWRDAQGFRFKDKSKIKCLLSSARIFHYGWARNEKKMDKKTTNFSKLYHGKDFVSPKFSYQHVWGLRPLKSFPNVTHPTIMKQWTQENKSDTDIMSLPRKFELRNIVLAIGDLIEKVTGYRIGEYKNYKIVGKCQENVKTS